MPLPLFVEDKLSRKTGVGNFLSNNLTATERVEENVLSSVMGALSSLSSGKKVDAAEVKAPSNGTSSQTKHGQQSGESKEDNNNVVPQNTSNVTTQSDSTSSQQKSEEITSTETGEDSLETRRKRREERRKQREEEEKREREEAERKREERRRRLDALKANS